ncbi:guanine nucleotide exchange factor, putative [Entamoeba invadens IP1]|uniref:guanine nucleotide exchange factor, putative n=1 Tax=Entamoeba invadens IP1 TaxID=370355 RepID=UPI0002C3D04C|nr:guanine nucleotide exchange factor, putative [Entamoeba invadens IP1]ELP90725.1 guanine nucleotide exchange factor, putative [Entamoeba invadens IP1]|eukprot:XP_004257496.1 guanine nucleotide exchange factor, putative [Entamoeba invadens IP1]
MDEDQVISHQPGKSLVESYIPFHMNLSPYKPKKYSYWMDATMWSEKMLEKQLIKVDMRDLGKRVRGTHLTGKQLLTITSKYNVKLGADLQDWRFLLKYRDECQRTSAVCTLQKAIRSHLNQKLQKDYIYCSHVVSEIITTEQTYVQQLDVVVDLIMGPLKVANATNQIITEDQMRLIFFGLQNIQKTNHMLLDNLIENCQDFNQNTMVGSVFLKFTPFLKMYSDYCRVYNAVTDCVCVTLKAPHPFAKFIADQMSHAPLALRKYTLTSLLITPVQRLPRYKLMLVDLLKHYRLDHHDYFTLRNARDEVIKVATYVNEMSRVQESTETILNLAKITKGVPEGFAICGPDRVFLSRNNAVLFETVITKRKMMMADSNEQSGEQSDDYCDMNAELKEREVDFPEVVETNVTVILFNDIILFLTADFGASLVNSGLKLFSYVGLTKQTNYEAFYYFKHFKLCDTELEKGKEVTEVQILVGGKDQKIIKFESEKVCNEFVETASDYSEKQKAMERDLIQRKSKVFLRNIKEIKQSK